MFLENGVVVKNQHLTQNLFLLQVQVKKSFSTAKAGQFYMIDSNSSSNILKRPISLHNINKDILEFYYEVKGSGTKNLSLLKVNEFIKLQGPLGNSFNANEEGKNIVIIGGGVGIAPMKLLIKSLLEKNNNIIFIAGGSDSYSLKILENFQFDNITNHLITVDGSLGSKGTTVDCLKKIINSGTKIDKIYTCGPLGMMKAIGLIASDNNIMCEVSLESRMACGTKACVGCSIKTSKGMKKVCYDGPVFNSNDILNI